MRIMNIIGQRLGKKFSSYLVFVVEEGVCYASLTVAFDHLAGRHPLHNRSKRTS